MSKFHLLAVAASALLILPSCLKESHEETTQTYSTYNLVIPTDPSAQTTVSAAQYTIKVIVSDGRLSVATSDLRLGASDASFTTDEMSYTGVNTTLGAISTFSGGSASVSGMAINSLKGVISTLFFYPAYTGELPGINFVPYNRMGPVTVMQYKVGDLYTVKTIARDMTYNGSTSTCIFVNGQETVPFSSDKVLYRLVLSNDFKKADLVMYNAKFSEKAPELSALILKDLDVEVSANGFLVSGKNVEPQVPDGTDDKGNTVYTEYNRFTFLDFSLQTTGEDLTGASVSYVVENPMGTGEYRGKFTGSYVITRLD